MSAYGSINDGEQVIAWMKDGEVRQHSPQGELVGYEDKGEILDLARKRVGYLHTNSPGKILKAWWSEVWLK